MDSNETKALEIAAELGFLWNGKPHKDTPHTMSQSVADSSGRKFWLRFGQYNQHGRIVISGDYPKSVSNYRYNRGDAPRITVSDKRTAAAIAADIMARFYPRFCDEWQHITSKNESEAAAIEAVNKNAERLRQPLRLSRPSTTYPNTHPRLTSRFSNMGQVQLYDDMVSIDHLTITVNQALRIAEILGDE